MPSMMGKHRGTMPISVTHPKRSHTVNDARTFNPYLHCLSCLLGLHLVGAVHDDPGAGGQFAGLQELIIRRDKTTPFSVECAV